MAIVWHEAISKPIGSEMVGWSEVASGESLAHRPAVAAIVLSASALS